MSLWTDFLKGIGIGGSNSSFGTNTGYNPTNQFFQFSNQTSSPENIAAVIRNYGAGDLWGDIKKGLSKAKDFLSANWGELASAALSYLTTKEYADAQREAYNKISGAFDWQTQQQMKQYEGMQPLRDLAMPYFQNVMSGQSPVLDLLSKYMGGQSNQGGQQNTISQLLNNISNRGGTELNNNLTSFGSRNYGDILDNTSQDGQNSLIKPTTDNPAAGETPSGYNPYSYNLTPSYTSGEFKNMYGDALNRIKQKKMYEAKPFEAPPMNWYSSRGGK